MHGTNIRDGEMDVVMQCLLADDVSSMIFQHASLTQNVAGKEAGDWLAPACQDHNTS